MKKLFFMLFIILYIFITYSFSFSNNNFHESTVLTLKYEPTVKEIISIEKDEYIIIGYKSNNQGLYPKWGTSDTSYSIYYYPIPDYLQMYSSIEEAIKQIEKNYKEISMVYILTKEKELRRLSIIISNYKEWKEVDVPVYHLQLHNNSVKDAAIFIK